MKIKSLLVLLLLPFLATSQTEKGATPLPPQNSKPETRNSTRAVVVGISDYKSTEIPDLRFAHRDAEAFTAWLQSSAGGNVPADSIILLTEKQATIARFADALTWLTDNSREGDLAIIYFSGHGDVETKIRNQWGFLLCYDSPARSYIAGAMALNYLQDIVTTISLDNKARVLIVTDACHAGKLAGSGISGAQLTNANLARQFANESKIMSCQPNEFSLEGPEWGGGSGVFSWYLLGGLSGLADINGDKNVTLMEIGRYLEEKVPAETAPHQQVPITVGERTTLLARVDDTTARKWQLEQSNPSAAPTRTVMKGMEEPFLAATDSFVQLRYREFLAALDQHELLSPAGTCANDLYESLKNEPALAQLHNLMRRNLAIALQDEVQQALNALLDNDPYEANTWYFNPEKYLEYPALLRRAMELLTEKNRAYKSLKSKMLYFEGYNLARSAAGIVSTQIVRDSLAAEAKSKFLESLELEPQAAYSCMSIGNLYRNTQPAQTDSVLYWCNRAMELSPSWVVPLLEMSQEYAASWNAPDKSEPYLLRAAQLAPESYLVLERLAFLRQWQGKPEESKEICHKMIALKPDLFNAYATLGYTCWSMDGDFQLGYEYGMEAVSRNASPENYGHIDVGRSLVGMKKPEAAIQYVNKLQSDNPRATANYLTIISDAYVQQGKFSSADSVLALIFRNNLGNPTIQAMAKVTEAKIRLQQNKTAEATVALQDALQIDVFNSPVFPLVYALLGSCAALENNTTEAEAFFQKAVWFESPFQLDSWQYLEEAFYLYGNFLLKQNRLAEAEQWFQKSVDLRRKGYWGEYGFALLAARKGKQQEAINWLEKSLDNWYPDAESIQSEPLFAKIRPTKRFKELLAKRFPPGWEKQ